MGCGNSTLFCIREVYIIGRQRIPEISEPLDDGAEEGADPIRRRPWRTAPQKRERAGSRRRASAPPACARRPPRIARQAERRSHDGPVSIPAGTRKHDQERQARPDGERGRGGEAACTGRAAGSRRLASFVARMGSEGVVRHQAGRRPVAQGGDRAPGKRSSGQLRPFGGVVVARLLAFGRQVRFLVSPGADGVYSRPPWTSLPRRAGHSRHGHLAPGVRPPRRRPGSGWRSTRYRRWLHDRGPKPPNPIRAVRSSGASALLNLQKRRSYLALVALLPRSSGLDKTS